jgi:hypothetical protein
MIETQTNQWWPQTVTIPLPKGLLHKDTSKKGVKEFLAGKWIKNLKTRIRQDENERQTPFLWIVTKSANGQTHLTRTLWVVDPARSHLAVTIYKPIDITDQIETHSTTPKVMFTESVPFITIIGTRRTINY